MRELVNGVRGCVRGMGLCLRNQTKFKQNLNKIKAAPCNPAEEINFVKGTSYTGEGN